MRARTPLLLLALALGASLLLLLLEAGGGGGADGPAPREESAAGRVRAAAPASGGGTPPPPAAGRVELEAGPESLVQRARGLEVEGIPAFRGRVLLPGGEAAAGTTVHAWGIPGLALAVDPDDPTRRPVVGFEGLTDAEGRFAVPEAPRDGLHYLIRISRAELAPLLLYNLPARPGRTRELGDLVLGPGWAATGQVLTPEGLPVAGAVVVPLPEPEGALVAPSVQSRIRPLPGFETRTGADGRFRLEHLPPGPVRFEARAPGFATGRSAVARALEGEELSGIPIEVEPATTLSGLVLDPGRQPVPGARLRMELGGNRFEETVSGEDGRFRFEAPEEAELVLLRASAPGFWPMSDRLDEEERLLPVELVLKPLAPVTGVVVDAAGGPVAGASVALVLARRSRIAGDPALEPAIARARTAEDGAFALEPDLSRTWNRRFQVLAWAEGHAPALSATILFREDDEEPPAPLRLVLEAGLRVTGTVLSAGGSPLAEARVHLRRLNAQRPAGPTRIVRVPVSRRNGTLVRSATTGSDGRFAFEGLEPGDYRIEAHHPGHSPGETGEFALLDGPLDFAVELPPPSSILGRVQGDLSLFGQLRVTASSPEADDLDTTLASDGSFRFEGIAPGTWSLVLREVDPAFGSNLWNLGAGEGLARLDGIQVAPGETRSVEMVLDLSERAVVHGILRRNGEAAPDLAVFLIPQALEGPGASDARMRFRAVQRWIRSTTTDWSGRYVLAGLEPGDYWLVVQRRGAWPEGLLDGTPAGPAGLTRLPLELQPGSQERRDLDLVLGSLEGQIVQAAEDGGERPLGRGRLTLKAAPGREGIAGRRVPVGRDGRFRAGDLPAGGWVIEYRNGRLGVQGLEVTVPPGGVERVRLRAETLPTVPVQPIR